ncbi:ShKT domain-containing protein [Aphelenchoides fujianensis]|nr:ShKT domain-containing protein [Aphelenchoides fujianensis]
MNGRSTSKSGGGVGGCRKAVMRTLILRPLYPFRRPHASNCVKKEVRGDLRRSTWRQTSEFVIARPSFRPSDVNVRTSAQSPLPRLLLRMRGLTTAIVFAVCAWSSGNAAASARLREEKPPNAPRFAVLRAVPTTRGQLAVLEELQHNSTEINFWTAPRLHSAVDMMLEAAKMGDLRTGLRDSAQIESTVIIEDVERLIIARERKTPKNADFNRRFRDERPDDEEGEPVPRYDFNRYGSYTDMTGWMRALARRYPAILQSGRKEETSGSCGSTLTSKYGRDPNITNYVDQLTFVIIPNLNPDGFEFSRSSTRLASTFTLEVSKAARVTTRAARSSREAERSAKPESRAVRDAILSSRYRGRIDGFVTLHSYSQIWVHSFGHRKDSYPGDVQELYNVGKRAVSALSKLYGTKYLVGSGADVLSGGSEDWAKQSAGVKFVYLLELRPDEKKQLIPTAQETWAGIKVVADAIIQRTNTRVVAPPAPRKVSDGATRLKQYRFGDGTPGSCYDIRHACKRWIQENEQLCVSVPVFMREQCAYSCGYC